MKRNQILVVRTPRIGLAITMIVAVSLPGVMLDLKAQSSNSPVIATLPVGTTPYGLVVSPDGSHVYVANERSNDLSVIDVVTNHVEAMSVPAGPRPSDVRITSDGQYLYVTNSLKTGGTVSVIKVSTGALTQTITGLGDFPTSLAISPNGKFIYVTNFRSGTVSIINTATNQVSPSSINIGTAASPLVVTFTPDGLFAYVGNYSSNSISFVSTSKNQAVGSLLIQGIGPDGISITPDGKKAYVENWGTKGDGTTVSVVETYMPKVVKTITVGPGPSQSAITPDGNYLFVPLQGAVRPAPPTSKTVVVVDTRTDTVIGKPIVVGNAPGYVAITPDGKYAYVTNGDDNTVSVIDVASATGPFYTFRDAGTLGGKTSYANAINNEGVIVGQAEDIKGNFYAFRFANGVGQNLGAPPTNKFSSASAVNNAGIAAGVYASTSSANIHACIFANGKVTGIGNPNVIVSGGSGINDQDWVVGAAFNLIDQDVHAFLFRPGDRDFEDLGTLGGGTHSEANSVDNHGIITGFSQDGLGDVLPFFAQVSTKNTPSLTELPTLPADFPYGIAKASAELPGEVVAVGDSIGMSADHAVKWSLTTKGYPITDLGTLPGDDTSFALSINSTGQIVGFSGNASGTVDHAFVFENGSMKNLNKLVDGLPPGWSLGRATAINDYGQISGWGFAPDGSTHGFALSPTRPNILIGTLNGSRYEKVYFLGWVSYSHFVPLTDGVVVSNEQPTASILWGTTHARRQISATFSSATKPAGFAITHSSDRFTLQGTDDDIYVLQGSFNPQDPYVAGIGASNMRLLWFNPATRSLENAVLGNTGTANKPQFKLGAFDPQTDFHLGTYGVDPIRNVVWAVINHD